MQHSEVSLIKGIYLQSLLGKLSKLSNRKILIEITCRHVREDNSMLIHHFYGHNPAQGKKN